MGGNLARHSLAFYFALTYLSSWLLWGASGVLDYGGRLPPLATGWWLAQIGVFCPSLWALIFTAVLQPGRRRHSLALLLGLYVPAILLGLQIARHGATHPDTLPAPTKTAVVAGALGVFGLFLFAQRILLVRREPLGRKTLLWSLAAALQLPCFFLLAWLLVSQKAGDFGIGALQRGLAASSPSLAVVLSFDLLYGGALGEEIGWRAFALPRLLEKRPPLAAAMILGALWALWHLPIDLAGGFGPAGVGAIVIRLLMAGSLSVIITWYFIRSGHGMLTALLIHTTLNWLPVLEFSHYEAAMGLLLVAMIVFALFIAFGDPRLRRPGAGAAV